MRSGAPRTLLALLFVLGAVVAASVQSFEPTGWWLNSSSGVRLTAATLFVLAVIVAAAVPQFLGQEKRRAHWTQSVAPLVALWLGAISGLAAVLFAIGPGTIFPIVLAFTGVISGAVMAAGSIAGLVAGQLLRHLAH